MTNHWYFVGTLNELELQLWHNATKMLQISAPKDLKCMTSATALLFCISPARQNIPYDWNAWHHFHSSSPTLSCCYYCWLTIYNLKAFGRGRFWISSNRLRERCCRITRRLSSIRGSGWAEILIWIISIYFSLCLQN